MKKSAFISTLLAFSLLLAACNQNTGSSATIPPGNIETFVSQTLEASDLTLQETPLAPADTANTPGSVSQPPELPLPADLLLWAPSGSDAAIVSKNDAGLQEYANSHGLRYLKVDHLSSSQLSPDVKVVVSLAPAAQTELMAASAAQVQFLSLLPLQSSAQNLFYSGAGMPATLEQQAFMAGYTLALVTNDYRVGVLVQAGDAQGKLTRDAFTTGAQFYCGLCNSRVAPVTFYPKVAEMATAADWQPAVDELLAGWVTSIYIQPELSSEALVNYLISKNILLIGVQGQAGLSDSPNWVAVLASAGEQDLIPALDALMANRTPPAAGTGLSLTNVNDAYLSLGRLRFIEATRLQLLEGMLNPLPFNP